MESTKPKQLSATQLESMAEQYTQSGQSSKDESTEKFWHADRIRSAMGTLDFKKRRITAGRTVGIISIHNRIHDENGFRVDFHTMEERWVTPAI